MRAFGLRAFVWVCAALVLGAAPLQAAPIAVNFVDGQNDLEAASAFGIPLAGWTQTDGSASGSVVVAEATVQWASSNTWRIGGSPPTGEDEVYNGYLDDGSGGPTITLTGLGDWMAANGYEWYDVTVIMGSGDNAQNGFGEPDLEELDDTLLETFSVPGVVSYNGGSSLVGTGLSGLYQLDEIRIDGKQRNEVGSQTRGSIAAVIVEGHVPEPATLALLGLAACGLGGYVRRRRKA